ncbi:bifunctional phosphatase PAP2/diacylglycerol kinase family protein [Nakamurella flava]|uniref:bifunctional phosphatase PAP2/diacylglycerol kinase family protein n=1 Tax=Nakamurella flava TaxID=2576308 RepID=UPI001F11282D|nr:phosphatase PAP2 family protein [Nakamurella flava]
MNPTSPSLWSAVARRLPAVDGPLARTPAELPSAESRTVDSALRALTTSANHGRLWLGIGIVGALVPGRTRRAALRGISSLAIASFTSNAILKPIIGRRRPEIERTAMGRRIERRPWTSSFPSGHSASAAAFATGAALELPLSALGLGPLAAAVAYSRVHVGVHHRSDVVAGAAVGVAAALLGKRLWPVKPTSPALMAAGDAPALPQGEGLTVVVNARSGSSDGAADALRAALPAVRIVEWDPDTDLADALPAEGEGSLRALGVAGGDGTVASVAAIAHDRGIPLAVFPAGTFNNFAKSIGALTVEQMASAVEEGRAGMVDLGFLNGAAFLNTASVGTYPEMVDRRDRYSQRMGKWPATALAVFRTLRHTAPWQVTINDRKFKVWIVFVGNGRYTPRGLTPSWRDQLAGGVLDVQFLRADRPLSRTRAVLMSFIGLPRFSGVYEAVEAGRVRIQLPEGPRPVAHDGETTAPVDRLDIQISDTRLTVYRG